MTTSQFLTALQELRRQFGDNLVQIGEVEMSFGPVELYYVQSSRILIGLLLMPSDDVTSPFALYEAGKKLVVFRETMIKSVQHLVAADQPAVDVWLYIVTEASESHLDRTILAFLNDMKVGVISATGSGAKIIGVNGDARMAASM